MVENAFGILANSFPVLLTTMQHHPSTVKVIVKACIVLHNLMRIGYPGLQNQQLDRAGNMNRDFILEHGDRAGTFKTHVQFVAITLPPRREKKTQRNLLKHWANAAAGAVPFQDMMI